MALASVFAALPCTGAPPVGLVFDEDNPDSSAAILAVIPGSTADTAGLRMGDCIVAVGAHRTATLTDLIAVGDFLPSGDPIRVERLGPGLPARAETVLDSLLVVCMSAWAVDWAPWSALRADFAARWAAATSSRYEVDVHLQPAIDGPPPEMSGLDRLRLDAALGVHWERRRILGVERSVAVLTALSPTAADLLGAPSGVMAHVVRPDGVTVWVTSPKELERAVGRSLRDGRLELEVHWFDHLRAPSTINVPAREFVIR